jgi:outer membrane protein TolC
MDRLIFLLLFCVLSLFTGTVSVGHALTLEECVELALTNNPDLQSQQLNQQIANIDLKGKKSQNFGKISAVASYTHYNLPRTLVPMTPAAISTDSRSVSTTEDLYVAGITYEVPLFTGFAQKNSVEIAALQQEMAGIAFKLSREQLIYNVKTLYVNVLSLQSQEEAQAIYITALERLYNDISHEFKLGKRARVDQLKAAADVERARAQKAQIISSLTIFKATLASLLGVEQLSNFQEIPILVESVVSDESDFDQQIKGLQRYHSAELEVAKSKKLIEKSKATLYPQISFNAFYGQNFGPNDESNAAEGEWRTEEVWQAGLTMKWDLIDFGQGRSSIQMATIARQQSLRDRLKTELALKRDVIEAVTRINTAIMDYTSARTEFAMTRETENIEQIRFDKGAADLNDLLLAKARNQLALSRFINAGYTYKSAGFYLDYLFEEGETK